VIVGHAGIGTLLGTGRLGKPLILMPRRASLGEHRNEHQLATVAAVQAREGIYVAMDEAELAAHLETPDLKPFHLGEGPKLPALTTFLRDFIHA
jgi:UDP-N-acetylglucosamine transferase subunit ALG13